MSNTTPIEGLALLRVPFDPKHISKLPKPFKKDAPKGNCRECGGYHGLPAMHLDYVGHAALTHRLLDADPLWTWEPLALDEQGLPKLDANGGLWIRLTVCGVSRLGYGDADGKTGPAAMKERIGDALRNAAMRFGAALDLWSKADLTPDPDPDADPAPGPRTDVLLPPRQQRDADPPPPAPKPHQEDPGDEPTDADMTPEAAAVIKVLERQATLGLIELQSLTKTLWPSTKGIGLAWHLHGKRLEAIAKEHDEAAAAAR